MHEHMAGGDRLWVPDALVVLLVVAAAVHLRARSVGDRVGTRDHATGHAVMAAGMAYMLLPAPWRTIPAGLLVAVFAASAAYFLRLGRASWRAGAPRDALWQVDVAVADLAMVYMAVLPRFASTLITAVLIAYFAVYAASFAALVLWRGVTLEVPAELRGEPALRPPPGGVTVLSQSVPTASATAHLVMAAAALYMLTGR